MDVMSFLNDSISCTSGINRTSSHVNSMVGHPWLNPQAFKLLVNIFFSIIIVMGVIGNSLVIAVILRWKEMKTPCNIFLLNIGVADLLVTGIAGALRIIEVHFGWIFGDFLCLFLAPMQDVFVGVSAISHSTISWERFRATVTPFKPRISKTKAKCILPVIWVLSYITCGLPLVVTTELQRVKEKEYCGPRWSTVYRRIFEIFLVTVYIVLQLSLQTFAYLNIIRTLKVKEKLLNESIQTVKGQRSEEIASLRYPMKSEEREKKKSKTINILIVLVVVFQIGYIPRGMVMLIAEFSNNLSQEFRYIELISLILYYLKHVLSPVILFMMSTEFKNALHSFFLCKTNIEKKCGKIELQTTNAHV